MMIEIDDPYNDTTTHVGMENQNLFDRRKKNMILIIDG